MKPFTLALLVLIMPKLNPDFMIRTKAGQEAYREELAIALAKTPGANAETRQQFRQAAEQLAQDLFHKGEDIYKLPHMNLHVYWDSVRLHEIGVAYARTDSDTYEMHLSEIMFFSYHREYLKSVIPHEVAHLLHSQKWGFGNIFHDESFEWIVKAIAPDYEFVNLDKMPACRFLRRLVASDGYNGKIPVCE